MEVFHWNGSSLELAQKDNPFWAVAAFPECDCLQNCLASKSHGWSVLTELVYIWASKGIMPRLIRWKQKAMLLGLALRYPATGGCSIQQQGHGGIFLCITALGACFSIMVNKSLSLDYNIYNLKLSSVAHLQGRGEENSLNALYTCEAS